jgi:hypothetical protein
MEKSEGRLLCENLETSRGRDWCKLGTLGEFGVMTPQDLGSTPRNVMAAVQKIVTAICMDKMQSALRLKLAMTRRWPQSFTIPVAQLQEVRRS